MLAVSIVIYAVALLQNRCGAGKVKDIITFLKGKYTVFFWLYGFLKTTDQTIHTSIHIP